MWDHPDQCDGPAARDRPLSHDPPCPHCGHGRHTVLPCSDACGCRPRLLAMAGPPDRTGLEPGSLR